MLNFSHQDAAKRWQYRYWRSTIIIHNHWLWGKFDFRGWFISRLFEEPVYTEVWCYALLYCIIITYNRNKPLIIALWFSLQTDYIPADLNRFNQTGNVSLGFCKAERPHLDPTKKLARHTGIASNRNSVFHMIKLCIKGVVWMH